MNTVVALDRMDYIDKIERYLSDTDTYISFQRNPINKLIENSYILLLAKKWIYIKPYPFTAQFN